MSDQTQEKQLVIRYIKNLEDKNTPVALAWQQLLEARFHVESAKITKEFETAPPSDKQTLRNLELEIRNNQITMAKYMLAEQGIDIKTLAHDSITSAVQFFNDQIKVNTMTAQPQSFASCLGGARSMTEIASKTAESSIDLLTTWNANSSKGSDAPQR